MQRSLTNAKEKHRAHTPTQEKHNNCVVLFIQSTFSTTICARTRRKNEAKRIYRGAM